MAGITLLVACGSDQERRAAPRRLVRVDDFGAKGDGVTDDYDAISRAIEAAGSGTVIFSGRRYAVTRGLKLARASLEGTATATLVKVGPTKDSLLTITGNSRQVSVTAMGLVTTGSSPSLVSVASGATQSRLEGCRLLDTTGISVGLSDAGSQHGLVSHCVFTNLAHSVLVHGAAVDLTIGDCSFQQWHRRAIHVVPGANGGVHGLTIRRNEVLAMGSTAGPRQPISVHGQDGNPHFEVVIEDNTLAGPARAWTAAFPGTADQISVAYCATFVVRRNTSVHGGDMGITIGGTSARGLVEGNNCLFNDASGIDVGSAVSNGLHGIVVRDNICANNGQDRLGQRPSNGKAGVILQQGCVGTLIEGNILGDSQPRPTQLYAISVGSSRGTVLRDNLVPGRPGAEDMHIGTDAIKVSVVGATKNDRSAFDEIVGVKVPPPRA